MPGRWVRDGVCDSPANARGVSTVMGGAWKTQTLRRFLEPLFTGSYPLDDGMCRWMLGLLVPL